MKDIYAVNLGLNTCFGDLKYNAKGDVDGDNCITPIDLNFVSKYYGKKIGEITQCKGLVTPSPTLFVTLSAIPSSGTAPLTGVDLIANVSGTATGPTNYTFYCNRSDSGTNVTSDWCHKKDGINENSYTATDCCNFSSAGIYTAKVVIEKGTLQAESRLNIQVNPPPLSFKPESEYKCPDVNGDGIVDMKDIYAVNLGLNTCFGDLKYNAKGDVDGDNCLTITDLNFVQKYYAKNASEIEQCKR
jgi:hypothetical protein